MEKCKTLIVAAEGNALIDSLETDSFADAREFILYHFDVSSQEVKYGTRDELTITIEITTKE